jgi:hypothetical protein
MIGLLCFALAVLASPFKSKLRLEAENAVLRHQLIVLRRRLNGRIRLTNHDRWFLIQLYRWFPSILKVLTIIRPETLVRWHRVISGQIDYLCGNLGAATGRIASKQEKVLAVLSGDRSPLMPELRTAGEQGLEGLDITTWTAFFLPKGAPRAIVDKLNKVTHEAMETPSIKARMLDLGVFGIQPERRSPEYLAKLVADEITRWESPITSGGLQLD